MAEKRYRNFAIIIYPDSAPSNFIDVIREFHIPCFLSPFHDKDINPDGTPKKSHYHLLLTFDGMKSINQLQELSDKLSGVSPEIVDSIRGYARYLCHLDNPEKHQYPIEDVKCFSSADYNAVIGLATDKYKAVREMIDWCDELNISCYADLLRYASANRYDWFRVLCDCATVVMKEYLKSKTWQQSQTAGFNPTNVTIFNNSAPVGDINELKK